AQDTPVLLLDEPTASLDINHQIRTLEIVRSLVEDSANPRFAENPSGSDARESGKTVIAAIHDLNLAAHYCDVLVLLGDGEVLAAGPPTDVLTESNLETAFGTQAVVTGHPVTGSVYVMALPDGATEERREHVHVVGGGATGARLLYLLSAAGFAVTTGALNEGDSDLETARHLGIEAVTLPPGAPMDEPTTAAVRAHVRDAAVTVVADVEIGVGNLPNLEAAAAAENLVVVEDRPFAERNFVGPEARARYEELRGQAVVVDETEVISTVEDVLAGRSPPRD
ncbi:MAG: vitamin B12 ABC transporter ATP-binding protein BtuD, partial [Halorubrum sp.]